MLKLWIFSPPSHFLKQYFLTRLYCQYLINKLKPISQSKESFHGWSYFTAINHSTNNPLTKNICCNHNLLNKHKLFHTSSHDGQHGNDKRSYYERTLPKIFYYQNPFIWFRNRWNFRKLRNTWDPSFNEAEFTRGSKQAISLITNIISKDEFDSLEGLLTKKAAISVRKEVVLLWKDEVKRHIALSLDDIQLAVPTKIHFNRLEADAEKKICDIDMWFMALKWVEGGALLIIDIATRFNRNYEKGNLSDWTISIFQVRRFHVRHPKPENVM